MESANATPEEPPIRPFDTLEAMKAEHTELLRAATKGELPVAAWPKAVEFLSRGAATGKILDAPADRRLAQGLLDYWKATLYTQRRESATQRTGSTPPNVDPTVPKSVLEEFDEQFIHGPATAADAALNAMGELRRKKRHEGC